MKKIPDSEKFEIIDLLEEKGMFFRKFWAISDIYWSDDLPTAAVTIRGERIQFLFNRDFWDSLSVMGRLFIVCHEQLHLLNNHFARLSFDKGNAQLKNIAADVAINEMLIRNYSFEKTDLPNHENYCWLDTVFPEEHYNFKVSDNETAEYYYSILMSAKEQMTQKIKKMIEDGDITFEDGEGMQIPGEGQQTVDQHDYDDGEGNNQSNIPSVVRDAIEDALEELEAENPDNEEVKKASKRLSYKKAKRAGNVVSGTTKTHDVPMVKKRHWKKLYKTICRSIHDLSVSTHWAFIDNKMALLNTGVNLPGEYKTQSPKKTKVAVYLDVSGSCVEDTRFFLTHALSLPKDLFETRYFTFDTRVKPMSTKPPYTIDCGGGTCFECIRQHVEEELDYYDAVFVFTDGEATQVTAQRPNRWFWFLTPNGTHSSITPGSRSFDLNDYGWDEARYGKK